MKTVRRYWILLTTLSVVILAGLLALIWVDWQSVGNAWFMIGLAFLVGAAGFILEKGHLLAGWHRRRQKGEETLETKKIPVDQVASVKNGPIIVNQPARFCLAVGVTLIGLSILVTLVFK
ncbi:DUF3899 domain-containing protein [Secundilactobacillus kimchicus]|uniref:DUF3899 domain-containing protein n=1 Tax=Secundilactobacillus kimchicus TaxID=528209 RepID=UPI0024A7FC03|nr:DUF3899 domain-containing protein [Secundilactobacillus kimchicus]